MRDRKYEVQKKKKAKKWSLYFASFFTARLCTGDPNSMGVRWTTAETMYQNKQDLNSIF